MKAERLFFQTGKERLVATVESVSVKSAVHVNQCSYKKGYGMPNIGPPWYDVKGTWRSVDGRW